MNVAYARDNGGLFINDRAAFSVAQRILGNGDWQALADARSFVDTLVFASFKGNLLDDLSDKARDYNFRTGSFAFGPGFLRGYCDSVINSLRVMCDDFRADAIFQRRDNLATSRVIFRISREHQHNVQWQTYRIAFDLNVAFLHYVEKTDLNLSRQIGQFVDSKNAAISTRQQSIMNCQLIRKNVSAARSFNRIDIAKDICDCHVRCRQHFDIAGIPSDPIDWSIIALFCNQSFAIRRKRGKWIIVDLRSSDNRHLFIKQSSQTAQDTTLCLTAKTQQYEIVPG